jgi:CTP:molybdopterin cytidylyltransferase MocA
MTVAAVILAASPSSALADADGTPAVRRIADAAWAGGATPVVVVAPDPDGAVASALATAEVTLLEPAADDGAPSGPARQIAHGMAAGVRLVGATTAAIVWPARVAWADAETVTTLIEAHGDAPEAILRPAHDGVPGWPALLPARLLDRLSAVDPDLRPDEVVAHLASTGAELRSVDTGDPGTTHDITVPRAALPPFAGPPVADDGLPREWGAPAADQPDDAPPAGPARLANPDPAP